MNIKLLRKIRDAILQEPKRFNMNWWVDDSDAKAPCGTSACIAGYAVMLDHIEKEEKKKVVKGKVDKKTWVDTAKEIIESDTDIREDAQNVLDLDDDQCRLLFDDSYWPLDLRNAFRNHGPNTKKAGIVAAKRIDHFIKTEGQE